MIEMKAKEYFAKYVNEYPGLSNEQKVIETFRQIVLEAGSVAKIRNVKSDSGWVPIFRELNQKANSFCRMVNEIDGMDLRQDAFMHYVKHESPSLHKLVYESN